MVAAIPISFTFWLKNIGILFYIPIIGQYFLIVKYIRYQRPIIIGSDVMDEAEITKTLEVLTAKVNEIAKTIKEKKEYAEDKIRENPLAYMAGAFAGGLIVGYMIARGKRD